jgi:hypothetical protein
VRSERRAFKRLIVRFGWAASVCAFWRLLLKPTEKEKKILPRLDFGCGEAKLSGPT